jgi:hypothetical protein
MAGTITISTLSDGTNSTSATNPILGSAKAWANFNGSGSGSATIRSSYNVSSVTYNGTGDYTVNFTTAFATANYSAVVAGYRSTSSALEQQVAQAYNYSTASVRVGTGVFTSAGSVLWAASDFPQVNLAVFSS